MEDELKLGEMLETPSPGLDKANAISKAIAKKLCLEHHLIFYKDNY